MNMPCILDVVVEDNLNGRIVCRRGPPPVVVHCTSTTLVGDRRIFPRRLSCRALSHPTAAWALSHPTVACSDYIGSVKNAIEVESPTKKK